MSTATDDVLARLRTIVGLSPGTPEAKAAAEGVEVIEAQQLALIEASDHILAWANECGNCTDGMRGGDVCIECAEIRATALRVRHGLKRGDDSRVQGWEPISEAPQNGSAVLCWRHGWDEPVFLRWGPVWTGVIEVEKWYASDYSNEEPPTHFLPLGRLPGNP